MVRYQNVSIRKELIENIREIIRVSGLGYRSITEFVNDAVRRRVEEIKKSMGDRDV